MRLRLHRHPCRPTDSVFCPFSSNSTAVLLVVLFPTQQKNPALPFPHAAISVCHNGWNRLRFQQQHRANQDAQHTAYDPLHAAILSAYPHCPYPEVLFLPVAAPAQSTSAASPPLWTAETEHPAMFAACFVILAEPISQFSFHPFSSSSLLHPISLVVIWFTGYSISDVSNSVKMNCTR